MSATPQQNFEFYCIVWIKSACGCCHPLLTLATYWRSGSPINAIASGERSPCPITRYGWLLHYTYIYTYTTTASFMTLKCTGRALAVAFVVVNIFTNRTPFTNSWVTWAILVFEEFRYLQASEKLWEIEMLCFDRLFGKFCRKTCNII
jgi:hypothetical protein